ncbi:nucleocapsid [Melao virus]|uniref:Nucleoprotein n=1 Tax=Melao virus TaxID=35515 RepID=Q83540_9VIRU|nr:nucleocapsid [Melao virus]AAB60559.1 N protein [Melao virus]APA28995.1 nucleocapsid [Melao virus]WIM48929.1 nucleocapsid protein [Melao virus]prf//2107291N nucleocapsid protein [Melao virus]
MGDLIFYDVASTGANGFDPDAGYLAFTIAHGEAINLSAVRIFFLNAAKAKAALSRKPERKATPKFGDWQVEIVNNHFPGNRNNPIGNNDLTIHRLSGYLARWVLDLFKENEDESQKELIQSTIINPIAESNGIHWANGVEIYLSFFPGTEMFLEAFRFYPLTIGIYRVKHGLMDPQYLKKALRQRYGTLTADKWMAQKTTMIAKSLKDVEQLKWGKGGLSDAARTFLQKFGVRLP